MEYKERIKRSFSKAAPTYDHYAFIQKKVAARLIDRTGPRVFKNILEIGCGTGNYTKMLMQRFPTADITAIDFSAEMISVAAEKLRPNKRGEEGRVKQRVVRLLVDDGETFSPGFKKHYDLITSNSTFQWFTDLKKGLEQYRNLLADEGTILFSIMGPETFQELYEVIEEVLPTKVRISARYFINFDDVTSLLHEIFGKVKTSKTVFSREHDSFLELLKTMKYTGVNIRRNGNNVFFTPTLLKKAETAYFKRFGSIRTHYQVFLCEARV